MQKINNLRDELINSFMFSLFFFWFYSTNTLEIIYDSLTFIVIWIIIVLWRVHNNLDVLVKSYNEYAHYRNKYVRIYGGIYKRRIAL